MREDREELEVVVEEMGAASELTCDSGNAHREMNGQPLLWL